MIGCCGFVHGAWFVSMTIDISAHSPIRCYQSCSDGMDAEGSLRSTGANLQLYPLKSHVHQALPHLRPAFARARLA